MDWDSALLSRAPREVLGLFNEVDSVALSAEFDVVGRLQSPEVRRQDSSGDRYGERQSYRC
jgi:hypothetical protein